MLQKDLGFYWSEKN